MDQRKPRSQESLAKVQQRTNKHKSGEVQRKREQSTSSSTSTQQTTYSVPPYKMRHHVVHIKDAETQTDPVIIIPDNIHKPKQNTHHSASQSRASSSNNTSVKIKPKCSKGPLMNKSIPEASTSQERKLTKQKSSSTVTSGPPKCPEKLPTIKELFGPANDDTQGIPKTPDITDDNSKDEEMLLSDALPTVLHSPNTEISFISPLF